MKIFSLILLLIAAPTLKADDASESSEGDCKNIELQLDSTNINLSPDSPTTFYFHVKRSKKKGCDFFVTADNGSASSYTDRKLLNSNGADKLPMQICLDSPCTQIQKHFPQISSSSDVITGSFPDGSTQPKDLIFNSYLKLGSLDYQKFGSYRDTFNLRLYIGDLRAYELVDTKNFQISYEMAKKIDLSLVSRGGSFDQSATTMPLNFGELSTAAPQSFDLILKYNAGYRVRYSSANNGKLKNISGTDTVPYSLTINSSPIELSSSSSNPVSVQSGSGVSLSGGLKLENTITVGSVGGASAGNYADDITISVTTTE